MWAIIGSFFLGIIALFGEEIVIDSPKEITPAWEERVLGIKHGVTTLDNAVHEMTSSIGDAEFDKAFFVRIKDTIKQHPNAYGEYREYWDNGNLKARLPYKDGKAHGHVHGWYKNGKHAFKGHFCEGVKQGVHISFFPYKTKGRDIYSRMLFFNLDGTLNGDQCTFHRAGNLWICIEYENNKVNGYLEGWDQDRKYFLSAQYKDGFLQKDPPLPQRERPIKKWTPRPLDIYVDEVTREFEKIAAKEFGAIASGSGGGAPHDVVSLSVNFNIYNKLSMDEARILIVNLSEIYLALINSHEKLRPYLREYPFTANRVQILISINNKKGVHDRDDQSVALVMSGGTKTILYCTCAWNGDYEDLYEEPYEDALATVKALKTKDKK